MALYINGIKQGSTGTITITSSTLSSVASILLKPSGDTDDFFTLATASNIPTIYGTGSYVRIGDAATSNHSLASEDDLMVSGKLEVDGVVYFDSTVNVTSSLNCTDDTVIKLGTDLEAQIVWHVHDTNANELYIRLPAGDSTNVPVVGFGAGAQAEWGLFDGITQPLLFTLEKARQLHTATDGIADAGAASAILKHVGGFTAAVVGDIVRVTAGTNCTAGWYWITTVTSADQVTLDRNYTSGDTTNVTFVTFHNFPMIGADGVCLKCFDGAPGDANVEIDRDGWLELDVSQANGRLYWRANSAWHYVDATA